jgi:hypothetical protein
MPIIENNNGTLEEKQYYSSNIRNNIKEKYLKFVISVVVAVWPPI